jgi:hypothetical protein
MEGLKWTLGRHILESITCLKQRRESLSEAYVEIISVDIKDTGYSREEEDESEKVVKSGLQALP